MADINNPFETDEVVGVIDADSSPQLQAAADDAGFTTVMLTDAAAIDVDGETEDGFFPRILRFLQQGEERQTLVRFRERLMAGDHVIRLVEVGDRVEEAGSLLADHGAELVWHYGKWSYTPLHRG